MKLYETGNANVWTDPHIMNQMLAAHLNPSTDAATRKPSTIEASIDWILKDCKQPGSVVDLGCGPGIYAEMLAARKWTVLGIDINTASIEYARRTSRSNGLEITYLERSYLEAFTEEKFDLGICIYCDFGALTYDQQKIFLKNTAKLLKSGGTFVFDVFGPRISSSKKEGTCWTREEESSFWSEKSCYVLSECHHFEDEQVWGQKYVVIPDGENPKTYVLWDHYFSEDKIINRLMEFGFRTIEIETSIVKQNDFASEDVLFVKAIKT